MYIIDPIQNKLIYEEIFTDDYYFYAEDGNILKDEFTINSQYKKCSRVKNHFYILIKKPAQVIIKEYNLLSIMQAFDMCYQEGKMAKTIELFEQNQELNSLQYAKKIFLKKHLFTFDVESYPNFCYIVNKV